jgi:hypothetical protein
VPVQLTFPSHPHTLRMPGGRPGYILVSEGKLRPTNKYRGENVAANTMSELADKLDTIDAEYQRKKDRQARLKTADVNPVPALMRQRVRSGRGQPIVVAWVRVGVRGVHATRDEVLITLPDGTRDSIGTHIPLLRELTEAELSKVQAAQAALAVAEKELPETVPPHRAELDLDPVPCRYDPDTDTWVAEFDGQELRADNTYDLQRRIRTEALVRQYPFRAAHRRGEDAILKVGFEVHPTTVENLDDYLFETEEAARSYVSAFERWNEADDALRAVLNEYALDLSPWR